jgi:hypothetical protein
VASSPPEERVDPAKAPDAKAAVTAGTRGGTRRRAAPLAILFAAGLAYGATRYGVVAFGAHDDHATEMSALAAGGEPINRWVTVRGRIAPGSFYRSGELRAFRLLDGGSLILVTNARQHPSLNESSEESFTGVLSEPGLGGDKSDEVSLHGEALHVRGIFGGYCKAAGCVEPIKVLLVGEVPKSRIGAWFAMLALSAIALSLVAWVLKQRRKKGAD